MAASYEISFAGEAEYIILPEPAVHTVIRAVQTFCPDYNQY